MNKNLAGSGRRSLVALGVRVMMLYASVDANAAGFYISEVGTPLSLGTAGAVADDVEYYGWNHQGRIAGFVVGLFAEFVLSIARAVWPTNPLGGRVHSVNSYR